MKVHLLITVLLVSTSVSAKQKFYKWTDENGNTHYTSEKPENKKTDEINVSTKQAKAVPATERSNKLSQKTSQVNQQQNKQNEEPEKSYIEQRRERKQKEKQSAQKNRKQCQRAKNSIKKYQQQVRMSKYNDKGEKVYLDDSKRTEIINKSKQAVRKYCK